MKVYYSFQMLQGCLCKLQTRWFLDVAERKVDVDKPLHKKKRYHF